MVTRMTTRKTAILLAVMALAALAAVLLHRSLTEAQEDRIHTMPPMTLAYKTDGPAISVGDRSVDFKETRRLDYTSRTKYLDSVRCPLYLDHASLLLGTDRLQDNATLSHSTGYSVTALHRAAAAASASCR